MADDPEVPSGPIATATLIGHDGAEQAFLETAAAQRMPHAWLLSGPRGIGKMTLAYRMARFQLSGGGDGGLFGGPDSLQMAPEHDVFRRILAGSLGDLQVLLIIEHDTFARASADPEAVDTGLDVVFQHVAEGAFVECPIPGERCNDGGYDATQIGHDSIPLDSADVVWVPVCNESAGEPSILPRCRHIGRIGAWPV